METVSLVPPKKGFCMSDNNPATPESSTYHQMVEEAARFLDVPMKVAIQLGQRNMKVREILQLRPNSIVEIPKSAGENVDILINGRLLACGEVLEIEGNAGVRLTDILPEI